MSYEPTLRITPTGIDHVVPPDGPVCDFCCERPVAYCYPAQTFVLEAWFWRSVGSWAACAACAALVEAGDTEGLAQRCIHPRPGEPAWVTEARGASVRASHAAFLVNRCGPRHGPHGGVHVGPHPGPEAT